jgi:hypothetical protein
MKTYEIFNSEKLHDFTVTADETSEGTEYRMKRSDASHWSTPGELILICVDNGSDIVFSNKVGRKTSLTWDYAFFTEMRIFLNVISEHDKNIGNYKMIESTNLINV